MNERITLVSKLNKQSLNQIKELIDGINIQLCKVPFGKNVNDRLKSDTLPTHFTISAWSIAKKEEVLEKLEQIKFHKTKITIDNIDIMKGKENSYVLYFDIKNNDTLKQIQNSIYEILPTEKYNPNNFKFHITIHISKDYEEIMKIKEVIKKKFQSFDLIIDTYALYQIYPAVLIKEYQTI